MSAPSHHAVYKSENKGMGSFVWGAVCAGVFTLATSAAWGNTPPVADVGGPYTHYIGGLLNLDGSGSIDPDSELGDFIFSYAWDLNGDGVSDVSGDMPRVSWATLEPLLRQGVDYPADPLTGLPRITICLCVTDLWGATNTASTDVPIYDRSPFAVITNLPPTIVLMNQSFNLDGTASTHGHPDYCVVSWSWHLWKDGRPYWSNSITGARVAVPVPEPGLYDVRLRVQDNLGQYADTNAPLLVVAGSPIVIRSSVLDSSGTQASGGSFTNLSAAGQPGGIAVSSGGTYVNQAGFLNTFFMKPGLDTDRDGLADEADMDNDNDSLADTAEVSGTSFSPVTVTDLNEADSDGDGMSDYDESVAGTNPLDENALLLLSIQCNPTVNLSWVARNSKTYRVRYAASPMQPITNVLSTVTASGFASAPWYVLTNTLTDAAAVPSRVYVIEVLP